MSYVVYDTNIASLAIKGRMPAALAGRLVGPNVRLGVPARRRDARCELGDRRVLREVQHLTRSRAHDDLRPLGHYGSGMGDFFAGISVTDFAGALAWHEKLFGSPPAFFPNDVEAVWELDEHRYAYIVVRPEHAGHALTMLFVDDLDDHLAKIAARGLEPAEETEEGGGVRKVTFRDPDGNEFAFGGNPTT